MRYLLLLIGSALSVLFLAQMSRGKRFDDLLETLDGMEYPLCALYTVGFAWSALGPISFRGKTAARLKQEAGLLYETKYADYYSNVVWAQSVTLIHLFLALTFLCAGLLYGICGFVLAVGLFLTVFAGVYSLTRMKNQVSTRREACESQLAEVVSTMAVLLNSGMVLRDVWNLVSDSGAGEIHELMRTVTQNMNNGMTESDAIYHFGRLSGSSEIKKFTSALLQSMEKGGAELVGFMQQQSTELWNIKRQRMLQGGERAATKLLLPTLLIFAGVIVIVLTAAFAGSLF